MFPIEPIDREISVDENIQLIRAWLENQEVQEVLENQENQVELAESRESEGSVENLSVTDSASDQSDIIEELDDPASVYTESPENMNQEDLTDHSTPRRPSHHTTATRAADGEDGDPGQVLNPVERSVRRRLFHDDDIR